MLVYNSMNNTNFLVIDTEKYEKNKRSCYYLK